MKRPVALLPFAALMLIAAAPKAQEQTPSPEVPQQETPDRLRADHMVRDAALQPLVDVNLKQRKVSPLLETAVTDPYGLGGLRKCAQINAAIVELDTVLGPDIDSGFVESRDDRHMRAGGEIAKSLVGGLIPFRGVVRELTGAGAAQRRHHAAVEAGQMRRAYLKGYGKARKCKPVVTVLPPTSPVTTTTASR